MKTTKAINLLTILVVIIASLISGVIFLLYPSIDITLPEEIIIISILILIIQLGGKIIIQKRKERGEVDEISKQLISNFLGSITSALGDYQKTSIASGIAAIVSFIFTILTIILLFKIGVSPKILYGLASLIWPLVYIFSVNFFRFGKFLITPKKDKPILVPVILGIAPPFVGILFILSAVTTNFFIYIFVLLIIPYKYFRLLQRIFITEKDMLL